MMQGVILTFIVALIAPVAAFQIGAISSRKHASSPLHMAGKGHADSVVEVRDIQGLQNGMRMRKLPNSDLVVSEICLGSMMYGGQVSRDAAMDQLDMATSKYGINFVDTAEADPAPANPDDSGRSERIIGRWMKSRKIKREDMVISSKICGYSSDMGWAREGESKTQLTRKQIVEAVDRQLERLGTDYIDLLQFQWPDRYVPLYGAAAYQPELEREDSVSIMEQLEVIGELMKAGKIRSFGLSNESPYGVSAFATTAKLLDLPKPSSVQNPYNLLLRNEFEGSMHEVCSPINANCGLLAYSPLAGGALTGKYLGKVPDSARMRKYVGFMHRYIAEPSMAAVKDLMTLSGSSTIPLGPLALAWVYTRPFVTSTIIGATSTAQLEENIMALNIPIEGELKKGLEDVLARHLDPARGTFDVIDPNLDYPDPSKLPWGAKDEDLDPELNRLLFGSSKKKRRQQAKESQDEDAMSQ
jgi:aryl-alcohol dehydrogenase-like predicted oxidoreductase